MEKSALTVGGVTVLSQSHDSLVSGSDPCGRGSRRVASRRCASTSPGPSWAEAERAWIDGLAARLREDGFECFVPHEQFRELGPLTPEAVFGVDAEGVRGANALVAWLDGTSVDDGTACEIGMFAQLVASGDPQYRGIVGIVTDLRAQRRRGAVPGDGLNLFVSGAILAAGRICWSVDEAVETLRAWRDE